MIFYHILSQSAYEALLQRGYLIGDGRRSMAGFHNAYGWMVAQMECRLPKRPRKSGKYPVWAWATPRPDLRCSGYLAPGTPGVRLTIEIDSSLVLLSDFMAWHYCLNGWYFAPSEAEDNAWEMRAATISPKQQQQEKQRSWEKIFDFDSWRDPDWCGEIELIQATFWVLEASMVKEARPFTSR
ncbi:DUF3841 domain-containing protein [Desulfovibrio inopinatus]|uniref:DUF3841 domain-containing protein n=1 Tax=Desulfovibrio inopinatus TaxID=102109 RepID=UPI000685133C|nr:DUF3841 domain-containing protein [Desulfovibrio inopinatus]